MTQREKDLTLALSWALDILIQFEPGDSRAVSDEFVSASAILMDYTNQECRDILNVARSKNNHAHHSA